MFIFIACPILFPAFPDSYFYLFNKTFFSAHYVPTALKILIHLILKLAL